MLDPLTKEELPIHVDSALVAEESPRGIPGEGILRGNQSGQVRNESLVTDHVLPSLPDKAR